MSNTEQAAPAPLSRYEARRNAPVALPSVHLPRWLVDELSLDAYMVSDDRAEVISAILTHRLAESLAAATPAPAPAVTLADLMVTVLNDETVLHQLYEAYTEGHFGTVIRDVATAMLPVVNGGR